MRTWLITGCSSGIGRGIAQAALENGDRVAVTARNVAAIANFAERFPERALCLHLDLTNYASMEQAIARTREAFGPIDVLVNNAGFGYRAAIEESERDKVDLMFRTNLFGPTELMNLCLPEMRERRSGIIVNVSSIGAVRAAVGNGFYSASKAALELVSDAVAKEAAGLGVKVMVVEPGAFRTNFYDSLKGTSITIDDYADTAGAMHIENAANRRDQPGDPMRAGKTIVDIVNSGNIPSHLPLGSDAVNIIRNELEARLAEVERLVPVSDATDFR